MGQTPIIAPLGYACFVFLCKNEGSKLDDKEGTHAYVIAIVYDWVGQAVTSHSGSSTDTCRYMVSLAHLPEPTEDPDSWQ